ncbi:MAG: hypothetical protein MJ071_06175 [Oscillospiraceae bacterium]|nr:hypothetical protein [Oscillospiraceae bacterium]
MKQKIISMALLCMLLAAGCGQTAVSDSETTEQTQSIGKETDKTEDVSPVESALPIASGDDVIEADAVGFEGMVPVSAASVKDGTYEIQVDSSSSMFKIAACSLTVADGSMTVSLVINSKSYEYLYAGTALQASSADASAYISPEITDDSSVFTFPLEALNQEIDCAAFSRKKQLWYDRKLVFRADSLPEDALPQREKNTPEALSLADGEYTVDVVLKGGSGRAGVQSPARLTITDKLAYAEIIWSSNKYDYMIVEGEKYLPVDTAEYSVFEIPVSEFDYELKIAADTIAMSTPHEIEYTLYFDSESIQ